MATFAGLTGHVYRSSKMIFRFVWNRKSDRISRDTEVKHIADGQIKSFMSALKLTWIRKLKTTNLRWKQIAC